MAPQKNAFSAPDARAAPRKERDRAVEGCPYVDVLRVLDADARVALRPPGVASSKTTTIVRGASVELSSFLMRSNHLLPRQARDKREESVAKTGSGQTNMKMENQPPPRTSCSPVLKRRWC
jgi:hypothetical protein